MNQYKLYFTSILMSASMLNIGCVSSVQDGARSAYRSVKRNLAVSPGSAETDTLYAQVRTDDQQRVNQLNRILEITKQSEVLANLERDRDELQRERSRVNEKMLEILTKEHEHKVELAKLEAIDRNRLGDKINNIENIADTHVEVLEAQQKRLQLESEVSILDIKIRELQVKIDTQAEQISKLKSNDTESRG